MIIKEDDAKKLICHQTFAAPAIPHPDDPALNIRDDGPWTCLGSTCMAWRWQRRSSGLGGPPFGYCGLVGDHER